MGMWFVPTWLRQVRPPASQNHFNHCAADPFPGAQDGQNVISWRWSLPVPKNPVWWGSMHAISSYRGNRPTLPARPPARCKHTDRTDYNTLRR